MSEPLQPPRRKDPLAHTRLPLLPPARRSRAAHLLTQAAAEGRFALPRCKGCGTYLYPVREACPVCLCAEMPMSDAPDVGTVLSCTAAEVPADNYFRERAPWHVGLVKLDCGPTALVHLHAGCSTPESRVRLRLMLDKAGQAVFFAAPLEDGFDMTDDPQWREMTADPKYRRALITDGRNPVTLDLVKALIKAEAREIHVGVRETWKPFPAEKALAALPGVHLVSLDLTDEKSVQDAARDYGAKTEILINTADYPRPGRLTDGGQMNAAREAMELLYFGQMRLAAAFGPVMAARGADGAVGAAAWVNLLSIFAEAHSPDFAAYAGAQSAALALSHSVRAELAAGGIRLMNVFAGPTDDDWYQALPQPKVPQKAIAAAIIDGLKGGLEDVYVGDVAKDLHERRLRNPKALERELAAGGH